jgi:hypothetical protein
MKTFTQTILATLICVGLAAMLHGCATAQQQQAQAALTVFCADVAPFNALIATLPNVSPKVTADIALAKPVVDAACANGAAINTTTSKTLITTGFPILLDVAKALPQTPEVAVIIADIQLAQVILPGVIALVPVPAAAAK